MKLKVFIRVFGFAVLSGLLFAQTEAGKDMDAENPNSIYGKEKLGDMFIHMSKITSPFKGSAPAIEMLFCAPFVWEQAQISNGWGQADKTFCYYEDVVPGTPIIFLKSVGIPYE